MNSYELKQQAKKERYLDRAERAETKSTSLYEQSRETTKHIPFGQPILVGHHSERGHRNLLKRPGNQMRKSIDESDKADYYKQKAESVGTGGISSDDPEALQKLKEKLNILEISRDKMKILEKSKKGRLLHTKTWGYHVDEYVLNERGKRTNHKTYEEAKIKYDKINEINP